MFSKRSRRGFLVDVGRGTLMATLGTAIAVDLGLAPAAFAEQSDAPLRFGDMEPLVALLQETPVERLQPILARKLQDGVTLKTLVAAGALANARTFGGEDYIGFHTFMALGPALRMASQMPKGSEALPVFKVLYRNTNRIQDHGGCASETLHDVAVATAAGRPANAELHDAIRAKDTKHAEQILSALVSADPRNAFDALIPAVQDNPEVHRTVLPYRAWEMQEIVGTEHALTLLRQSLHYCLKAESYRRADWDEHGKMLTGLLDEFQLNGKQPGNKPADDQFVQHLSHTFATGSAADAARAAASALGEGFDPAVVGEAISLAASLLVLRDGGRLPQYEDRLKPAGTVHGDSVGVHASDSANAWRNMARVSTGRNTFACLIIGAWQVARDRFYPGNLLAEPLPAKHHLDRLSGLDADGLLVKLDEAVQNNLQGHATAVVRKMSETAIPAENVFGTLLRYAVSEDGALHAEKYFNTVWDDFHSTRASARWQHLTALARVTASEYGKPAAGQAEARGLLGLS
jgi:hypothetical protein